ncbi:cytochrome P450 [Mycobacterium paraseoulense]|uniref:Cytochrome n=1 Tax=Mycobacterium paraseoulense TaxID=590652 RepID=A0A1X0IF84_9MYCO|nr:cytochrome P450 [Mycobacterium paraseoulense]MCV7393731.1 cytochrome P450 [Mycobacterium paraseoulense]ORB45522.1 cytochrome [Mycobacterium paraseoulense]BBZ70651.1 cytochrome P450 [Mycobacterium paraseoulense]
MTTFDDRAITDFDHHSPEYAENSRSINASLRAQCPVAHTDAHGGFYVISRYEDVVAAAKDDETFASGHEVNGIGPLGVTIPPSPVPMFPIEMDAPDYLPYRRLLNPLFSPAASKAWEPRVEKWIDICLDQVIETGSFDIVDDLANPVPSLFTCEFLGLPVEHWRDYAEVQHEIIYTPPEEQEQVLVRYLEVIGRVFGMITERRAKPEKDGLISTLVTTEIDGEPVPDEMVLSMVNLVMAGGFDTTTAVTANALIYLADNPQARQQLIDNPDMIPQACEEFLRYFTPQQGLARTVTKPVTVGEVELKPNDRVLLSWASANQDESAFDNPDEVVLDRFPNRHTTFGIGIHRCLGSHIARIELATMVRRVLARMPDYKVNHDGARRYPSIGVINGWINVPATFTPGERLSNERLPGA